MVLKKHDHRFVEDFKLNSLRVFVRPQASVENHVQGGQEQQQLNLQERPENQVRWDGHKDHSAGHEDGVVPDVERVSVDVDAHVQV